MLGHRKESLPPFHTALLAGRPSLQHDSRALQLGGLSVLVMAEDGAHGGVTGTR
jgi:hypothetical protein